MIKIRKHGSGGNRKKGRNLAKCAWYKNTKRRERNKIRKIRKHFRKFPQDKQSAKRLVELKISIA